MQAVYSHIQGGHVRPFVLTELNTSPSGTGPLIPLQVNTEYSPDMTRHPGLANIVWHGIKA